MPIFTPPPSPATTLQEPAIPASLQQHRDLAAQRRSAHHACTAAFTAAVDRNTARWMQDHLLRPPGMTQQQLLRAAAEGILAGLEEENNHGDLNGVQGGKEGVSPVQTVASTPDLGDAVSVASVLGGKEGEEEGDGTPEAHDVLHIHIHSASPPARPAQQPRRRIRVGVPSVHTSLRGAVGGGGGDDTEVYGTAYTEHVATPLAVREVEEEEEEGDASEGRVSRCLDMP